MTTLKVQNTYLISPGVPRARAFYEAALGLSLTFQDGDNWAQFRVGATNFSIASQGEGATGDPIGCVAVFEVDDVESAVQGVEAHGGAVLARRDMGSHGSTVTFRDVDGNIAQLFQRASGER